MSAWATHRRHLDPQTFFSCRRAISPTTINSINPRLREVFDALCVLGEEDCCGSISTVEEVKIFKI